MTASGLNASAIPGACVENKRLSEDEGVIFSWLLWTLARDVVTCFQIGPAEKRRALSQRAFGECRSGKEFCETLHPTCVFMCVTLALTSGLTPLYLFQNHETALASLLVLSCNGFPVASNGVGYLWDTRPKDLPGKELPTLWDDLTGADAVAADRAFWALTDRPDDAVKLFGEKIRLQPAVPWRWLIQVPRSVRSLPRKIRYRLQCWRPLMAASLVSWKTRREG